jgi:2-polyprenyl-3-methyl-5-hydroxy-6-metoxy-1,4-benzoquinol methylase
MLDNCYKFLYNNRVMTSFNLNELNLEKMNHLFQELESTGYYFKKEDPTQIMRFRKNSNQLSPLVKLFGLGLPVKKDEISLSETVESEHGLFSPFSISSEDNGSLHLHDHWPPKEDSDYIHLGQESFYLKKELDVISEELKDRLVLDLGCGQGLLAHTAASHKAKVLGLDCSERSIQLANLFSRIYNLQKLEFIQSTIGQGSHSLNAVRKFQNGQKIDLIVFNPPLVVSHSDQKITYRDGEVNMG